MFTEEHNRAVAQKLREKGVEVTPDQVGSIRQDAFKHIRKALEAKGYAPPKDDAELLQLIAIALKRRDSHSGLEITDWEREMLERMLK